MSIKNKLKQNKITYFFIKKLRFIQLIMLPKLFNIFKFNLMKYLRLMGISHVNQYKKLKLLKNKHVGERCFIVGTGPSLTIEDLEKLHNENTYSMNSICLAFNETNWRPTYYGIQDIGIYNQFEKEIESLEVECKFISDFIVKQKKVSDDSFIYPHNILSHDFPHKKYYSKFSGNAFAVVYDGYSITYSMIQIAVYMGFKEIYLIGVDCNYPSNLNHHFREYQGVDSTFLTAGERMVVAYKEAKMFADKNNIKIYNATRGGMLELFERVNLDEVLFRGSLLQTKVE
ncbi:6-hydroxymethylpterin diphosphokinase MptE-like protein [Gottfriedia sp. NPDC058432]|uniref:6-hydroxymethylpterin diphosphokinase MptE-like protein n=1 Tax=Gottfriedia sp. NPDC058432 TaxID=3346497 RepID=UPI003665BCD9